MYSSSCHPGSLSSASTDLDGEDEREVPLKRSPERTNASMSAYCEATSELSACVKVWLIVPYGDAREARLI